MAPGLHTYWPNLHTYWPNLHSYGPKLRTYEFVLVSGGNLSLLQGKNTIIFFIHSTQTVTYSKSEQVIVKNEYDAIGQLKTKKLGPDGAPIETLNYDYNIRGWMLGSNRDYASNSTSRFGFELAYDKNELSVNGTTANYAATSQYNGNIAGMLWKSAGTTRCAATISAMMQSTGFWVPILNNLPAAASTSMRVLIFTANNLTYDANGNILTMNQRGWNPAAVG